MYEKVLISHNIFLPAAVFQKVDIIIKRPEKQGVRITKTGSMDIGIYFSTLF